MPTPIATHGCSWDPLTPEDLPALADLIAAGEYLDGLSHLHGVVQLATEITAAGVEPRLDGIVVRSKDIVIGYGWIRRSIVDGGQPLAEIVGAVHPGWRSRGIGPTLVQWQIDRAREWHAEAGFSQPLVIGALVHAEGYPAVQLFTGAGFVPQHWYHELHRSLDEPLPPADPPAGVVLVRHDARQSAATLDGAVTTIRTDLSWLAMADGDVVGHALNGVIEAEDGLLGWTEEISAVPAWRNRGLLGSLLGASLRSFTDAGLVGAAVSVDTESGQGARPYLELGYSSVGALVWYVLRESGDPVGLGRVVGPQTDGQMGSR